VSLPWVVLAVLAARRAYGSDTGIAKVTKTTNPLMHS